MKNRKRSKGTERKSSPIPNNSSYSRRKGTGRERKVRLKIHARPIFTRGVSSPRDPPPPPPPREISSWITDRIVSAIINSEWWSHARPWHPFPLPPSSFPDAARSGTTVEFIKRAKNHHSHAACNGSIKMARACVPRQRFWTDDRRRNRCVIARIRSMISWRWWTERNRPWTKRFTWDLHVEWELGKFVPLAFRYFLRFVD